MSFLQYAYIKVVILGQEDGSVGKVPDDLSSNLSPTVWKENLLPGVSLCALHTLLYACAPPHMYIHTHKGKQANVNLKKVIFQLKKWQVHKEGIISGMKLTKKILLRIKLKN